MSWTEVDITNVSTEMALLPEGDYVFSLLPGAKYSQWDKQKIELGAKVVEGEYTGRVQYFSYGDPDKAPAMLGAFKRLEIALTKSTGVSAVTGQDPVEYLNDPEVVGGKFIAPIKHRSYVNKEDATITKSDVAVFKVRIAA